MNAALEPARLIGQSVLRREDRRMLTGRGRFTDDVQLPGVAYASVLRSSHAHARIVSIDTAAATATPGVIGVLTAFGSGGESW